MTGVAQLECEELNRIYPTLEKLAVQRLRREPLSYLWSPGSLINEAYLRLAAHYGRNWVHHANVLALWGRAMRNVLVDGGRASRTRKRDINKTVELHTIVSPDSHVDFDCRLALRQAMKRMAAHVPRQAGVIHLRFVAGLSLDETARALQVSERTVKRALREARIQLLAEIPARPSAW